MSGKGKITQAEKEHRLTECALYLSQKSPTHGQFIDWFMEKYSKGRSMANFYWIDSWAQLTELRKEEIGHQRTIRIAQLEYQYRKACTDSEIKTAANILMMLAKLEGIDVNKHEIDAKVRTDASIFKIVDNDD